MQMRRSRTKVSIQYKGIGAIFSYQSSYFHKPSEYLTDFISTLIKVISIHVGFLWLLSKITYNLSDFFSKRHSYKNYTNSVRMNQIFWLTVVIAKQLREGHI